MAKVPGDREEVHVTGLEPNHQYKFRVTAINDEGDSEPLETEAAIIAKNPYGKFVQYIPVYGRGFAFRIRKKKYFYFVVSDEPTKPGTPEIVDYDNESVQLKWAKPESDGGARIEKYIIEKKDKYKPDWEKATEVPGDTLEAKVPDLKERAEYQFRVIAVNKAGPSPASDPTKTHCVRHKARKYCSS